MALEVFRGRPFEHTHENRAFDELIELLEAHCTATNQRWYLFGNFYVGSRELDAMVVKPNAVVIIDFKDFRGTLQFAEEGPWLMQNEENGSTVEVKGGASINPLRQLRTNKGALSDFFKRSFPDLSLTCNWRHTAAVVVFQGPIHFDRHQLPGSIKPWFHISEMGTVVRDLEAIVSREIFLRQDDVGRIVLHLGIDPFVPAGVPRSRKLLGKLVGHDGHKMTSQQSHALESFSTWLQAGKGVFCLVGMASTGKRFLFPHLINALNASGKEPLLLTPSARVSSTYHHPSIEPISIYTWLYSLQPSYFEKKDGRKIGIHELKRDIDLDNSIPVLVDAHLLSDEDFDGRDRRYGSGRLIQDFLSVATKQDTPFVIVGDPYQMPRGSLQRSLVGSDMLEKLAIDVTRCLLTEQVLDDENDALSKFQAHLVNSLDRDRFNRLPRASGKRLEILEDVKSKVWMPDTSNVRAESVLVCGTHEQATKINGAVKTQILRHQNPTTLGESDRIDFHNRTPVLASDPNEINQGTIRWISSGDIGLVDFVDESIETYAVDLRGRSDKITLRFQCARCRLPSLGEVNFRYLVNYFEADRPEISVDLHLALQVLAKQLAKPILDIRKRQLPDKSQSELYKNAKIEYDKFEYQTLQAQGYLSAALIRPAHAMTVHRAQGRQWPSVWVNASRSASSEKPNNSGYFRWLYTASACANEMLTIRLMPLLSTMSNMVVRRAHNLVIEEFPLKRGLFYDASRQPTEHEYDKRIWPPGFSDPALLPLLGTLNERLAASSWCIEDWQEYSYQVVATLKSKALGTSIRIRMNYDKKLTVTNLVYLGASEAGQQELQELLVTPFIPQSEYLIEPVSQFQNCLAEHGFEVLSASETSYRVNFVVAASGEGAEIQVNTDKEGMISTVLITKSFSESILQKLVSALAVPS